MIKKIIFVSFVLCVSLCAQERETISSFKTSNIRRYLKEGTHQYFVVTKKEGSAESKMSLWSRTLRIQKIHEKNTIVIQQQWLSADSTSDRTVYSLCDAETFSPLYHYSFSPKNGIEAYNFSGDKISGADTVQNNTKKDFTIGQTGPTLNWELDLETLPLLDFYIGKIFSINFYHPGGNIPPREYMYKVLSEERISVIDNSTIDCWILKISYDEKNYSMFWISKEDREVIKVVEKYNSTTTYKILLSTNTIH